MYSLSEKIKILFSGKAIPFSFVVSLVIPVIIDQFFLVGFNFINTAMISSSGTQAVSAVNMVGSLHFFLVQIFTSVGLGGTVLIAQYYGRRYYKELSKVCSGTIFSAVIMALIVTGSLLIFHEGILNLLFGNAEAAVLKNAKIYLVGLLLSYPMQAVVEGVNGNLRGIGQTKASLKLSLLMNAMYILFNFIFINQLNMGIRGLAVSVNISRCIGMLFAFYTLYANRERLFLKKKDFTRIRFSLIRKIVRISLPFAAEAMFFNGGKIIVQIMIVGLGTNAIAANAIASSWIQLAEIIPNALAISLVPIVGQCIGNGNIGDAKKLTKSFVILSMIAFLIVDLTLLPLFPLGMKLFNPPEIILPMIFRLFIIALVMHFISWSISFVLPAALRAAGDAKFTTVVSLLSMWIFRIGVGYLIGIHFGFGLTGIYTVMTIEWFIRGSIFLLRFKGSQWYRHQLI
ncbi:MATE family efflux transporter [Enterococcus sp. BWB1-3]|uniref:MATE family efflux transporter n=1 Tax=unclassified Enterococcus TaxID=2608891 RepID=UPI001E42D36C|nr:MULTISPECIES: MATE family efflux transporter [unclassified Enterococcus]MBL1230205.1 MATE family efflux transporter [Enterococcus sp. BWB1-3]MCB5953205.1 MATE family efflux transporter [Enterococcus sp. BWT-B8]MCB5953752.1 MATE family efflux transporter [Enterococcus sp. CWB-B31]